MGDVSVNIDEAREDEAVAEIDDHRRSATGIQGRSVYEPRADLVDFPILNDDGLILSGRLVRTGKQLTGIQDGPFLVGAGWLQRASHTNE